MCKASVPWMSWWLRVLRVLRVLRLQACANVFVGMVSELFCEESWMDPLG